MSNRAYYFSAAPRYVTQIPSSPRRGSRARSAAGPESPPVDAVVDDNVSSRGLAVPPDPSVRGRTTSRHAAEEPLESPSERGGTLVGPSVTSFSTAYVVYTPQGSRPMDGVWAESLSGPVAPRAGRTNHAMPRTAYCAYDRSTGSQLLHIPPNSTAAFLSDGSEGMKKGTAVQNKRLARGAASGTRGGLPLSAPQRVLVIQLCPYVASASPTQPGELPALCGLSLELTLRDRVGQRRLLFSSTARSVQSHVQHTKVPFEGVRHQAGLNEGNGQWMNLFLDVGSLHQACFDGGMTERGRSRSVSPSDRGYRLKQVKLTCTGGIGVKVRRILAMHAIPAFGDGKEYEWVDGTPSRPGTAEGGVRATLYPLPESLRLPAGVESVSMFIRTGKENVLVGPDTEDRPLPERRTPSHIWRSSREGSRREARPAVRSRRGSSRPGDHGDSQSFIEVSALTDVQGPSDTEEADTPFQRTTPPDRSSAATPPRPSTPPFMQRRQRQLSPPSSGKDTPERTQQPPQLTTPPNTSTSGTSRRASEWVPALTRLRADLRKAVPLSLLHLNSSALQEGGKARAAAKSQEGIVDSPRGRHEAEWETTQRGSAVLQQPEPATQTETSGFVSADEEVIVQELSNDASVLSAGIRPEAINRVHDHEPWIAQRQQRVVEATQVAPKHDFPAFDNDGEQYRTAEALMELMAERVRSIQKVLRDVEGARVVARTAAGTTQRALATAPTGGKRPATTSMTGAAAPTLVEGGKGDVAEREKKNGQVSPPRAATPTTPVTAPTFPEESVAQTHRSQHSEADEDAALDRAALELWRSTEEPLPSTPGRGRLSSQNGTPAQHRRRHHRKSTRPEHAGDGLDSERGAATPPAKHVDHLVLIDSLPSLDTKEAPPELLPSTAAFSSARHAPPPHGDSDGDGEGHTPAKGEGPHRVPFYSAFLTEAPDGLKAQLRAAKRLSYGSTMDSSSSLLLRNTIHPRRVEASDDSRATRERTEMEQQKDDQGCDLCTVTYRTTLGGGAAAGAASATSPADATAGAGATNLGSLTSAQTSWTFHSSPFVAAGSVLHSARAPESEAAQSSFGDRSRHYSGAGLPTADMDAFSPAGFHAPSFGADRASRAEKDAVAADDSFPMSPPVYPKSLMSPSVWRPGRLGAESNPTNPNDVSVGSVASTTASGLPPPAPKDRVVPGDANRGRSPNGGIPYSVHSGRVQTPASPGTASKLGPATGPSRDDQVRVTAGSAKLGLPPTPAPSSGGLRTPVQQQNQRDGPDENPLPPTVPPPQWHRGYVAKMEPKHGDRPSTPPKVHLSQTDAAPPLEDGVQGDAVQADLVQEDECDDSDDDDDGFFFINPADLMAVLALQQQRPPRYPLATASSLANTSTMTATTVAASELASVSRRTGTSSTSRTSFTPHNVAAAVGGVDGGDGGVYGSLGRIPFYQRQQGRTTPAVLLPSLGSASVSSLPQSTVSSRRAESSASRRRRQTRVLSNNERYVYDPALGCYLDFETNSFIDPGDSTVFLA